VTRLLIAQMADLCRAHGIRFSVVMLRIHPTRQGALIPFARARGIDVIECQDNLLPGDTVPGEFAHPNGRAHAAYARCVADALAGNSAGAVDGRAPGVLALGASISCAWTAATHSPPHSSSRVRRSTGPRCHTVSGCDESVHLYEAKRVLDGEVLYRDVFNFITPAGST